jgi:choline dehydrogenase
VPAEEFDTVVVGGGSAGCTFAGRLAARPGLGHRVAPGGAVLGTDRALDGWIAAHLATAHHLCGTTAMGAADHPLAVVDPSLRLHGLAHLRIVDPSGLPTMPRRGTAATAVAIGEAAAEPADAAG